MARKEGHQLLVLCNLIATSIWIAAKFQTSGALERPYHLSICVLGLSGLFWYFLCGVRPASAEDELPRDDDNAHSKQQFEIEERQYAGRSMLGRTLRFPLRTCTKSRPSSLLLVACIVTRALILRRVVRRVECAWDGVEIYLPLLLCLLEFLTKDYRPSSIPRFDNAPQPSRHYNFRYVLLLVVWVLSAYGTVSLSADHSTYICPHANHLRRWIRTIQVLGVFLDAVIINIVSKISREGQETSKSWARLSQLALATAGVMFAIACLFLWWNPPYNHTPRYLNWSLVPDLATIFSMSFAALLCTNFVLSAVYLLAELRPATIAITTSCVCLYIYHMSASSSEYSVIPQRPLNILCGVAFGATFGLLRMEREASKTQIHLFMNQRSSRALMLLCFLLTAAFCGQKYVLYTTTAKFPNHPITALITNARSIASNWERQATGSMSITEAVEQYQSRYGIPPPPHFDKWWDYALARDSIIKDDFGQIHEDLLPFWGIKPSEIRNMTAHMIERPWTEVAGLRISNGTTALGPHMPATHRWMVEGAANMINKFAEWLPDMDLAFNINDESRVAIPWKDMQSLKENAEISRRALNRTKTLRSFSTNREWADRFMEPEAPYPSDFPSPDFKEASLRSSFMDYGVTGCPPNSLSKKQTWWNKNAFCHDCAKPHSVGPILANWTLSGSLCHQPDLANLHGFHLSPSAFKPTKKPFPIFSQSKIPTFNDIIFPSPWNYEDKVIHNASLDMTYSDKDRTVFWRGATSEGYAIRGTWQGMQRQRFVHIANYSAPDSKVNLLLPDKGNGMGYNQQPTTIAQITSVTNISVSFVGGPARCYGPDCDLEVEEFEFGGSVDFQDHWKYKFLFDLDGAGFSGRFLPFLESRSLVFRAAGFRQWFDERLVAWRHFVPVDARLHDVWHLIAYFGGTEKDRDGEANGHDREGEKIAEEGRAWAAQVLRKEDMEVYMFRLLLEWGRIVDDRREELGFVLG
ncbi:glycosyltransferase family 90 protein [Hyaloscypha variabilis F]|uniref:Glycosyltransferase family 90 protein n=1 Tax=Hyaloscypha variabilis (strain UAMH 11265 / GT02V1 / F) TaxID=1149755 RepID=A0A2J6RTY5_HYAVF|nr:glycosyltransferase family 90 protein [Hyaloscypha variabilis F]